MRSRPFSWILHIVDVIFPDITVYAIMGEVSAYWAVSAVRTMAIAFYASEYWFDIIVSHNWGRFFYIFDSQICFLYVGFF